MMPYEEEVIQVEEEIGNYCDALLLQKQQLEKEIEPLKLPAVSMCFHRLEIDDDNIYSSSSSSDENNESPDCSSAEEEDQDGASEELKH